MTWNQFQDLWSFTNVTECVTNTKADNTFSLHVFYCWYFSVQFSSGLGIQTWHFSQDQALKQMNPSPSSVILSLSIFVNRLFLYFTCSSAKTEFFRYLKCTHFQLSWTFICHYVSAKMPYFAGLQDWIFKKKMLILFKKVQIRDDTHLL